jgi:hypothetical protein
MMTTLRFLALALAVIAAPGCQGEGAPPKPETPEAGSAVTDAGDGSGSDSEGSGEGGGTDEEPAVPAEAQLDDLGAIAAWQAVIDRDRYLARRGQHGVVYGRVGAPITIGGEGGATPTGMVWLVDDTEGNGVLAIRIRWPTTVPAPAEGQRVAAGGAWALDEERQWFWQADRIQPVVPAPPSTIPEPPLPPGHVITTGDPPSGWKPITAAKDDSVISFEIVGTPPVNEGDGWKIADELGDEPFALLLLPGERASYGGHDLRAADEKWRLKKNTNYWLRIGKIRRRNPDALPVINARTAPVKW